MNDVIKFSIGQKVSYSINPDKKGVITGILFRQHGPIFLVTWSEDLTERYNYDYELNAETESATYG